MWSKTAVGWLAGQVAARHASPHERRLACKPRSAPAPPPRGSLWPCRGWCCPARLARAPAGPAARRAAPPGAAPAGPAAAGRAAASAGGTQSASTRDAPAGLPAHAAGLRSTRAARVCQAAGGRQAAHVSYGSPASSSSRRPRGHQVVLPYDGAAGTPARTRGTARVLKHRRCCLHVGGLRLLVPHHALRQLGSRLQRRPRGRHRRQVQLPAALLLLLCLLLLRVCCCCCCIAVCCCCGLLRRRRTVGRRGICRAKCSLVVGRSCQCEQPRIGGRRLGLQLAPRAE